MSHLLKVDLSDTAYAGLQRHAQAAAVSPAELASAALEEQFGIQQPSMPETEHARCRRFERHFGAVDLGYPTGADNDGIDADLARAYGDPHEEA